MSKILCVDCRMAVESKNKLISMGYGLLEVEMCSAFDNPVSAHPDMQILKLGNTLFTYCSVHNLETNFDVIKLDLREKCKLRYPEDIALNCAVAGKNIICNEKYTEKLVLELAYEKEYKIIDVNQGYAKCSTCVVSDSAIITEDDGIACQAEKNGISVLKIKKGSVRLDGYNYGFIGGASGLIEENLLAFNGNIQLHPDAVNIIEFCNRCGTDVISLNNQPLYDVGSIIRL